MAEQPFEIMSGPLTLYEGPVGEAFPDVDNAVTGNWNLIGTSGASNYDSSVVIRATQTLNPWRGQGESGPVKVFRTDEDLVITVTIADMTLEQLRFAFANNTVSSTAGPPAIKTLGLYRGPGEVTQRSLLVRGPSPYMDGGASQFEVPVVTHSGSPEIAFEKGTPAGIILEYMALVDLNATSTDEKFGRLIAQTA